MCVRSSIAFYGNFNLDMGRSPGFGSTNTDLLALFRLGIPSAPKLNFLTLPVIVTRRTVLQKVRGCTFVAIHNSRMLFIAASSNTHRFALLIYFVIGRVAHSGTAFSKTQLSGLQAVHLLPFLKVLALNSNIVLPQFVNTGFQVLFHSPPGVLFTVPSQYYSLSVTKEYLALRGGPRSFPQGSSCLVVLWILLCNSSFRIRDFHPLWLVFPGPFY